MSDAARGSGRPRLARWLWGIGFTFFIAAAVGVVDAISFRSGVGSSMLIGGGGVAGLGMGLGAALRSREPGEWRRLGFIALGVWPFASFLLFLGWQIAMSVEQAGLCEGGDVDACLTLAERKQRRGKSEEAIIYAEAACELESIDGCALLGSLLYYTGDDDVRALELLEGACDADHPIACSTAGRVLSRPPYSNPGRASEFFQRACDLGVASSCGAAGDQRALDESL